MDANLQAFLYREGSRAISSVIGLIAHRPRKPEPEEITRESFREKAMEAAKPVAPVAHVDMSVQHLAPPVALPTAEETKTELKRRLGRELYKAELDLSAGLKIADKPCDCLDNKHRLGIEAEAEELIASDPRNPVYQEILQWFKDNGHKVTIAAISSGEYKKEYDLMANQFKEFRKRVLGTAAFNALAPEPQAFTLEQAKKIAADEAMKAVEEQWEKQEPQKVE
jgi:hypothetical protein